MSKRLATDFLFLTLLGIAFLTACATAPPAVQPVSPTMRYLIDPRIGYSGAMSGAQQRRFENAWNDFLSGRFADAQRRFDAMSEDGAAYLPARLGAAAIALEQSDFEMAESILNEVAKKQPVYYAADVYRAELDLRAGRLESAYSRYGDLSQRSDAPEILRGRYEDVRNQHFESLLARASSDTSPERSVAYLRQALLVRPDATAARMLLVRRLIALGKFEDARRQIEPLIQSDQMPVEMQEALVDIDVGRGDFEEAIARLERLDRSYQDPRYRARLEQIKTTWAEANLPTQYHHAIASEAITREDLAVLIFWKITAVRFAQNLPEPPIATDIGGVVGREELVRALALRLFSVDAITRQVDPGRLVSGAAFLRIITRVAQFRGASCANEARSEVTEIARAQKTFEACRLPSGTLLSSPEAPVSGRFAADVLARLELLASSK